MVPADARTKDRHASWNSRIPASTIASADRSQFVHTYFLWKTNRDATGYHGYIDRGDGTIRTAYYVAPASSPPTHRRDTLWHWHTDLADARNETCYTGNSHVKPMIQVVDDNGAFRGWVGVEVSLNETTPAGAYDDDIGVFRITS
ncbi:hypothetical protein [Actinomadura gamaensis]|uniref:Uncharacterized protein n=1 Tax=Actinomadura gamaensis TaxID=1763541 RepID=A0ABV9U287_9ACTN